MFIQQSGKSSTIKQQTRHERECVSLHIMSECEGLELQNCSFNHISSQMNATARSYNTGATTILQPLEPGSINEWA